MAVGRSPARSRWILAVFLSPLLLALAVPAESQGQASSTTSTLGRGFFQTGYLGLDVDPLNDSFAEAGFPSLEGTFLTLGGAGYGNRGRFLVGGEGHGILQNEDTTPDGSFEVSASGGYGLFRLGYTVFSSRGFDLFPLVGVGGGGVSVGIKSRSAPTFGDVLDDPSRSSSLSAGAFLLDLSVGANYRIVMTEEGDAETGGMVVGLQIGYTFQPGETSWQLDGLNSVAGGPDLKIQGFHVRLSVGGWGEEEEGPPSPD